MGSADNSKEMTNVAAAGSAPVVQLSNQHFRELNLHIEYKHIANKVPRGVYIIPSHESMFVWYGVIFLRQGIYRRGIFKFVLEIPENYPEKAPSIRFLSPIFHPLISAEDGSMELSRKFPGGWRPGKDFLWMILARMKKNFYNIDFESPLNSEASQLYQNDKDEFTRRAEASVEESLANVYSNPTIPGLPLSSLVVLANSEEEEGKENEGRISSLRFSEPNSAHEETLKNYLESKKEPSFLTTMKKSFSSLFNLQY